MRPISIASDRARGAGVNLPFVVVSVSVATVLALAGCGSGGTPSPRRPRCSTAALSTLAEIGQGLTTPPGRGLFDGERLALAAPVDGYTTLVAARVNTGGDQPIGVWALDSAGVDAVDATAQRYTRWGSATQPDSQTAADRRHIVASAEYAAVKACVPALP